MVNQIPHESCYFGIQATVLLYLTLSLQRFIPITPPPPKNTNSKYLQGFTRLVACLAFKNGLRTRGLLYFTNVFSNFQKFSF